MELEKTEEVSGRDDSSRFIGDYQDGRPGPLFFVLGGLHGNEPSGVIAARRFLETLKVHQPPLRGRMIAFAGNLGALEKGKRFLERDLNRIWTDTQLRRIPALLDRGQAPEAEEQSELLLALEENIPPPPHPVYFLDLHSISASGAPFTCIGDTLANQRFIGRIPLPAILGLQESIDGSLLEYMDNRGYVAVAIEGGSHKDPETALRHESALWLALVAGGGLTASEVPDYSAHKKRLESSMKNLPRFLEIRYRHGIRSDDQFVMKPGFFNLQSVHAGEVVAQDRNGPITIPETGRLLLPLYQGQGEDGFFVVRELPWWRRTLSALLRILQLWALLPCLMGVRRHPKFSHSFIVRTRTRRMVALFNLFGFRKRRQDESEWIFSRSRNPFTD